MADIRHDSRDALTGANGQEAAVMLARRYPGQDWLAAVAKGAVMSRGEVERHFQMSGPLPDELAAAVAEIDRHLETPDAGARDHVFAADTNDHAAAIEVDGEAGLNVVPGPQPKPARAGSVHEMGQKGEVD